MSATKTDLTAFNAAVKASRNAAKNVNNAAWIIGDSALTVQASYGQGKVQTFCDAIGMVYKTVLDFRSVAEAYAASERSTDNSHSIHQVFMREEDRAELVKSQKWTVKQARELVKSRKATLDNDAADGNDGDGDNGETDQRAKLAANVERLRGELVKAEAALAAYDAEHAPATKVPALPQHITPGVPAHDESSPRTDCPACQANGITPMPAPRKSRTRKPATAAA